MVTKRWIVQSAAKLLRTVGRQARQNVQRLSAHHGVGGSTPEIENPAYMAGEDIVCSLGKP